MADFNRICQACSQLWPGNLGGFDLFLPGFDGQGAGITVEDHIRSSTDLGEFKRDADRRRHRQAAGEDGCMRGGAAVAGAKAKDH